MRRGTRVGQAYVAVSADGSGINKDIAEGVEKAGPEVEKAGEDHGEGYGEHFSEGFLDRMRSRMPRISAALSSRFGRAGEEAGDEAGKGFVSRMASHGKNAADKLSAAVGARLGSNNDDIRDGVSTAFDDDFADRIGRRFGEQVAESLGEVMAQSINQVAQSIDNLDLGGRRGGGGVSGNTGGLSFGDRIGGMLGGGSRNNFLNLMGKSVGGLINLMGKAQSAATGLFNTFKSGFINASAAGDPLIGVMGGIQATATKIGPAIASAIPAIIAMGVAMTVLVSIASALLALVVALASTIASALVAALAVGAGAMMAMVAAGGLLTAAFMSMTDAQQDLLANAFQPLKAEMVGLGQIMIQQMVPAFSTWSSNLQRALYLVTPLAERMGQAFARAGNIITASLSGPGFQRLAQSLGVFLPSIVTRLSRALGGFLNGIAGMFAAILPYVNRFAGYLARVGAEFAKWANSARGQNAIVNFVERALRSLSSLWNFVKALGSLIVTVLFNPAGQNAGNTIFDRMAAGLRRFTRYISQENRLEEWFETGIEMAATLGSVIQGVGEILAALNKSGVISGLAAIAEAGAAAIQWWSELPSVLQNIIAPITAIADAVGFIGSIIGGAQGSITGGKGSLLADLFGGVDPFAGLDFNFNGGNFTMPDLSDLINSGNNALNNTGIDSGGYKPPSEWKNPWREWAENLIKDGPGAAAAIRQAMAQVARSVNEALRNISLLGSRGEVRSAMTDFLKSLREQGRNLVDTAQQNLNAAAADLAGATSPNEAKQALEAVKRAQKALRDAERQQERLNKFAERLERQSQSSSKRVNRLLKGLDVEHATLADYAAARARLAVQMERATAKLQEAIALRENFQSMVTDSIRAFGALTTATAKSIDGVEQALTAGDITSNLEDRLKQIREFRDNLRLLLAQGLSNDAYQQIIEMGVEGGAAYAEALLAGGGGAIGQVNDLVGQITGLADRLGLETSSRLYQAGVDAARGLVDGLESMQKQLDKAARRLGNSIADAIKDALGIKSPSTVMIAAMNDVGDGMVIGLAGQKVKVANAAADLAGQIATSPANAVAQARRGEGSEVSGNLGPGVLWTGDIVTPTEDPHAVAMEALNELTGRL